MRYRVIICDNLQFIVVVDNYKNVALNSLSCIRAVIVVHDWLMWQFFTATELSSSHNVDICAPVQIIGHD